MTTVNFQELTNLYNTDSKVKALFDLYATRERGRQDSTPPRMRRVLRSKGIDMTTTELSSFYRKMQQVGVGRCVSGRRGKVSRFIWGFHLKSVAEAAKGGSQVLTAPPKDRVRLPKLKNLARPAQAPAQAPVSVPRVQVDTSVGTLTVRKDGFVIELPLKMTREEWKDAAQFLNNLTASG